MVSFWRFKVRAQNTWYLIAVESTCRRRMKEFFIFSFFLSHSPTLYWYLTLFYSYQVKMLKKLATKIHQFRSVVASEIHQRLNLSIRNFNNNNNTGSTSSKINKIFFKFMRNFKSIKKNLEIFVSKTKYIRRKFPFWNSIKMRLMVLVR